MNIEKKQTKKKNIKNEPVMIVELLHLIWFDFFFFLFWQWKTC